MRVLSILTDWNDGKKITVYEEDGKLYVKDNFYISCDKKMDIDRWLSGYKIFYGEDKNFDLIKGEKRLFEIGVYNN